MNRKLLSLVLVLVFGFTAQAQVPSGYYDSANGLTGYPLKTQLKKIIDNVNDAGLSNEYLHIDQGYNSFDDFTIVADLDIYYENDNTILDPYSENPTGTDPYNYYPSNPNDACGNYNSEGDCYNKEHVIPQSVFSQNAPMKGDAHHLLPTDGRVNGFRSNYPFGIVNDNSLISQSGISNPTQNGSKLGANINSGVAAGYSGTVFEPIDEFKGDIARIYFYFITRYEDQVSAWSSYPMFNGTSDQVLDDTFLAIMLEWNANDPVSQKEIDRNNAIFNYQNNRNPFIDHPEYIALIWSGGTPDTQAPTIPQNLMVTAGAAATILNVSWDAATDDVAVAGYDIYINGSFLMSTTNTDVTVNGLTPNTNYCFTVTAYDIAGNTSAESTSVCLTTPEGGTSGSPELFFSEYIEGSGSNKALEIANFTGSTVNLDNYSIKLSSNGNSDWTTTYSFNPGSAISSGDVYVVGNGGLTVCTAAVDASYNAITQFNGNDAVGLFKNDVLIDIIGELGNGATFAENTTLIRNSYIFTPNTTYTPSEWTTHDSNYCELGMHTQDVMSTGTFEKNIVQIYPNPVTAGNVLHINTSNVTVTKVSLWNTTGTKIFTTNTVENNAVILSNIAPGLYMLEITSEAGNSFKKLVIQ